MFVYVKLIGSVLGVLRRLYCSCLTSNRGDYHGLVFPATYSQLVKMTKDLKWINAALEASGVLRGGNRVTMVEVTPFGASVGFFSELANMKITYERLEEGCIEDVIVKFLPHGLEKR